MWSTNSVTVPSFLTAAEIVQSVSSCVFRLEKLKHIGAAYGDIGTKDGACIKSQSLKLKKKELNISRIYVMMTITLIITVKYCKQEQQIFLCLTHFVSLGIIFHP